MTFRKSLSALLATSLVIGSTAAAAATGVSEGIRQSAAIAEAEELGAGGIGIGWIIALVVAAGVALVIIEDDDDEDPVSP